MEFVEVVRVSCVPWIFHYIFYDINDSKKSLSADFTMSLQIIQIIVKRRGYYWEGFYNRYDPAKAGWELFYKVEKKFTERTSF